MYPFAACLIALGLFMGLSGSPAYGGQADEASLFLVQGGTGAGSASQGMGTGKSGTGKEPDAGRGAMGKKSPFGEDQPTIALPAGVSDSACVCRLPGSGI